MKKAKIAGAAGLVIAIGAVLLFINNQDDTEYITDYVIQDTIEQIVSVNGSVESNTTIDLRFETSGTVDEIYSYIGQVVTEGTELLKLKSDKLQADVDRSWAQVQIAQSELNLLLAGPSDEEIQISEAEVHEAEINYNNSMQELDDIKLGNDESLRQAELERDNAEIALESAQYEYDSAIASQDNSSAQSETDLTSAYEDAQPDIQNALDEVEKAIEDIDLLLGEFNSPLNTDFDDYFDDSSLTTRNSLTNSFNTISRDHPTLEHDYQSALDNWGDDETDDLIENVEELLEESINAVDTAYEILSNMDVNGGQIETDIETLKNTLSADQTSQTADLDALQSTIEAIADAKLGGSSSEITSGSDVSQSLAALNEATNNLEIAESNLQSTEVEITLSENDALMNIDLRAVQLEQAQAKHADLIAPPRDVEIASQQARVSEANASYQKSLAELEDTIIRAPADGIIAKIDVEPGQIISNSDIVARYITDDLKITANISETDITKVNIDNPVTLTLDAFPIDQKFPGKVVSIEPAETVIQGVVYYAANIVFDVNDPEIKPGMSANIDILTDSKESAIQIPPQALQYEGSTTFVYVLDGNTKVKRTVKLGLQGEQSLEILEGLEVGETIILYEK